MATLEQLTELQNLNECAWGCTRQSRWKESTQRYLSDMLQKNLELREEVLSGAYRVRPTVDFTISERGHVRQIEAPVVRDHNACDHSLRKMDALYASLVPPHQQQPRPGRRALVVQANREAGTEELRQIV